LALPRGTSDDHEIVSVYSDGPTLLSQIDRPTKLARGKKFVQRKQNGESMSEQVSAEIGPEVKASVRQPRGRNASQSCPRCGGNTITRRAMRDDKGQVMRYRRCLNPACARDFTTTEQLNIVVGSNIF
jgi:hypothetical protein